LEINLISDQILIIANGESILNLKLKKEINSFPIVARINNYSITGYEEYIGTKTDIWFNGANQALKKRTNKPTKVIVFVPLEILNRKGEKIYDQVSRRLNLNNNQYTLISTEMMAKFEQQLNVKRPTTGTSAILWALENYQQVIIHGFDFFIDTKLHYNESLLIKWLINYGIIKKASKHDMTAEKQYIEMQIQENNIIQLKDYLNL
tara:strand:- start:95 stop:712 length:618 start_codon:yes stop_codon:yes gene_type:complete